MAHVLLALVLGEIVWKVWWGFGRVLLPVQLLAFLTLNRPVAELPTPTKAIVPEPTEAR